MTSPNSFLPKAIAAIGCMAAALLLGSNPAAASEITRVGQWVPPSCGPVYGMSGHLAYLASGAQGLQIYCLESPRLSAELLGSQVLLQWPASATNWMLESAPSLPAQQWQAVPATPQRINDFYQLLIPATHPSAFFRLAAP